MKVWTVSGRRRSSSASRTSQDDPCLTSSIVQRSESSASKGPFVTAYLPAEPEPFIFGVRGAGARALPRSRNPRHNARLHCRRCGRAIGGFRMSLFGLEPRSHVSAADHECIVLLYIPHFIDNLSSRAQGSGAHGQQPGSQSAVSCLPLFYCLSKYSFKLYRDFF
jgi:hypothetical protein